MLVIPKNIVMLGFNLCSSLYIGIGGYGTAFGLGPNLLSSLSIWHSVAFGVASLVLIRGICYFGMLRDKIFSREAKDR